MTGSPPDSVALHRVADRVDRILLAWVNAMGAVALMLNQPGRSSALLFLEGIVDLRVWAVVFTAAAVLFACGFPEPGHAVGVLGWVMIAGGAVGGLALQTTGSVSGSLIFVGLAVTVAGLHVVGLTYRARARRRRSGG